MSTQTFSRPPLTRCYFVSCLCSLLITIVSVECKWIFGIHGYIIVLDVFYWPILPIVYIHCRLTAAVDYTLSWTFRVAKILKMYIFTYDFWQLDDENWRWSLGDFALSIDIVYETFSLLMGRLLNRRHHLSPFLWRSPFSFINFFPTHSLYLTVNKF